MSNTLARDVPLAAHAKAIQALEEFDSLVAQYEMLLDTQHATLRSSNFAALFELASRGDKLARDAALCGKRFGPLVEALASGQFMGPRATELRKRSFAARSNAETLGRASSRLANDCSKEREVMEVEVRKGSAHSSRAGLQPAYRTDAPRILDRRG